ncbi:hypothetical protein EDD18DRAFT_1106863 [Armillaria luteobubalina]|uniref:Uncharacterized protein n=1 Tax=Armillaria luteobubalina TaxID=153913 RepID=A0AA39Q4G8_9AGAR|nr:hypothetical protein EDD18DRAFT_1106863 [Armillaria luteobubalina]
MHFLSTVLAASCIFAPAFAASTTWQYMEMFSNHTGAVRASDYQTYTLVDSVQVYRDVNSVYTGDQMTCAVYTDCHTLSEADNYGGQDTARGFAAVPRRNTRSLRRASNLSSNHEESLETVIRFDGTLL